MSFCILLARWLLFDSGLVKITTNIFIIFLLACSTSAVTPFNPRSFASRISISERAVAIPRPWNFSSTTKAKSPYELSEKTRICPPRKKMSFSKQKTFRPVTPVRKRFWKTLISRFGAAELLPWWVNPAPVKALWPGSLPACCRR